ncbi:hypothetical protein M513_05172, partial [Trichuris suis]
MQTSYTDILLTRALLRKHQNLIFVNNVTSLIQPIDQAVIATLKRLYRKQLLRHLSFSEDSSIDSIISSHKKMTLKDYCFMIAERWYSIKQSTLRNAWNNIFIDSGQSRSFSNTNTEDEAAEILDTLKHLSVEDECNKTDIDMWLAFATTTMQGFIQRTMMKYNSVELT